MSEPAHSFGDWFYHVSPAIVGVTVGAIVSGLIINRFFVKKANLATAIERVCDRLDVLVDESAGYWAVPFTVEKEAEFGVSEAKIKAGVLNIHVLVTMIQDKYGNVPEIVLNKVLDLQDDCTGGSFESITRTADKLRILRIISTANKISKTLHELKL